MAKLYKQEVDSNHQWVTVVNPLNHRALLHACDCCGVVKSENSVIRACRANKRIGLITSSFISGSCAG